MKSKDKSSRRTIFGEFFFGKFKEDLSTEVTIQEIRDHAISANFSNYKIENIVRIEFKEVILFNKGIFTLNPSWGIDGFVDAVNIYRKKEGLPLLVLETRHADPERSC